MYTKIYIYEQKFTFFVICGNIPSSKNFLSTNMIRPLGGVDVSAGSTNGHSTPHFYTDKAYIKTRLLLVSLSGGERTALLISFDLTDDCFIFFR
ncbi:MAG: hypothetical protein H0X62_05295 [Bacteroidetes bacterium]|nr:hypothetical protein [Bacteroidota bacterium]